MKGSIRKRPVRWLRVVWMAAFVVGCAIVWAQTDALEESNGASWPLHELSPEKVVRLNPPSNMVFQASALLLDERGELHTMSDRQAVVYRIGLSEDSSEAALTPEEGSFAKFEVKARRDDPTWRFDNEGLARDGRGHWYLCEESRRRVLRLDRESGEVELLRIDWSPVKDAFRGMDNNAGWEGIAVSPTHMYLANERSDPLIVVVDLSDLRVVDRFVVRPKTRNLLGLHYSDLAWFEGRLFVLLRQHRVILQVDAQSHQVQAEYVYRRAEDDLAYTKDFPVGIMEGLAVDAGHFWLVTDNNGKPRRGTQDRRPTLLRFKRPDR